jgi:hypothetical protein
LVSAERVARFALANPGDPNIPAPRANVTARPSAGVLINSIVDVLAVKFAAPREATGKHVTEMLQGQSDKGVIVT